MDTLTIVMISLLTAPMLGLVIWAFVTTHPRHSARKTLFLRNKAVAVGIITICIVAVTVLVAWQAYEMAWCHSGLLSPVKCNHLPDKIGSYLFIIFFPGTAYLVVICLPALLLMGIAEWITRRKYRNFLTENATG
ncbi:hypothetical protein [Profundibacter sp.]